jgi:phage terminase large subunit-like protein
MSDRTGALSLARPDWRERILAGRSLMPDMPWLDAGRAARATTLYDALHIPDVPGQPLLADAGADWFREIVGALHGSLDRNGHRAIKQIFCLVPKKNSKTTNAAALMLTALMLNRRPRADFMLVGATQVIADRAFEQIEGMIDLDPDLKRRLKVTPHRKTIKVVWPSDAPGFGSKLQVKSFDPKIVTGAKPAGVLVDELHLLGEIADADRVLGQLRGGIISQPEGFIVYITTQSERPPAGVFKAELKKARDIRDGKATGPILPILYEFPEELVKPAPAGEIPRWRDTRLWRFVNPNADRSITVARLAEDFAEAELGGQPEVIRWSSQHLNIEIGLALRSDSWPSAANPIRSSRPPPSIPTTTTSERRSSSEVVVVGIDGGGLDDLLGFAALGRDAESRDWLLWSKVWAHTSVLKRRKSEAPKLRDFEKQGSLVILDQPDFSEVAKLVQTIDRAGKLPDENAIGVDPLGIGTIVDDIKELGIDQARVVGIGQGYKLHGAIKTLETKLASRQLVHAALPIMAWSVENAKVEQRGNADLVTKQASGRAKIDPLMAAFNAVALMTMNPRPPRSYLETDRLLIL